LTGRSKIIIWKDCLEADGLLQDNH